MKIDANKSANQNPACEGSQNDHTTPNQNNPENKQQSPGAAVPQKGPHSTAPVHRDAVG